MSRPLRKGDKVVAATKIWRADNRGTLHEGEVATVTYVSLDGQFISLSWEHGRWEASYCGDTSASAVRLLG